MADCREVGADLVGAPGLQTSLDQGIVWQQLEHGEVRARAARCAATNRAALRGPVVPAEGSVNRPGSGARVALDERQVPTPDLPRLDLSRKPAVSLFRAG